MRLVTPVGTVLQALKGYGLGFLGSVSGGIELNVPASPENQIYDLPAAAPTVNGQVLAVSLGGALFWKDVSADASDLTGDTLAPNVIFSSLTTVGILTDGTWEADLIAVGFGGTGADLSGTGGPNQVLQQATIGGPVTVAQLTYDSISGILPGAAGGTGVANTGKTITLGGNITHIGAGPTSFTTVGPTAVTLPLSGHLAPLEGVNVWTAANRFSANGASNLPAVRFTGIPFAGLATDSVPLVYIDGGGAAPLNWNPAGTVIGGNAPAGFTGDLLNYYTNGGNSALRVTYQGSMTLSGALVCTNITGGNLALSGSQLFTTSVATIRWLNSTVISCPSDGILKLTDTNGVDFTRLILGQVGISIAGTALGFTSVAGGGNAIIGAGTWQAGVIMPPYGGTGVANAIGSTITLGGAFAISGAFATTLTVTGPTNLTLPTSGVLATIGGTNTWTGAQLNTFNGAADTPAAKFTGTIFSGGTAAQNVPLVYIQPGGTQVPNWSLGGTIFGIAIPAGFNGNFIQFFLGTGSQFSVSAAGGLTTGSGTFSGNVQAGQNNNFQFGGGRAQLSSPGANTLQIGPADTATPVANILQSQGVLTATADVAGSNFTIRPGNGRGLGGSGRLILQTAAPGVTGVVANTMVDFITLDATAGLRLGTLTTQKLSFFGVTPIVQPAAASDIAASLVALGLIASAPTLSAASLVDGRIAAGVGIQATSTADGVIASGTLALDALTGNFHDLTNNGAFTITPPSIECTMILEITNGATAGVITTSGFTKAVGDPYTLTVGHKFHISIVRTKTFSSLNVMALQ